MHSKYCLRMFTFVLFGLISISAFAVDGDNTSQSDYNGKNSNTNRIARRIIFEGGLVNNGYEGGDYDRYENANGYSAGALIDMFGRDHLVLESGVLYRQYGTNNDNGFGNSSLTSKYLSVPISAKYYLNGQEYSSLYFKAGLMESYLVSNNTSNFTTKSWETSALAGLGLKLNISSKTDFMIEADYNRGLTSVFEYANVYRSDISGQLGLGFNL